MDEVWADYEGNTQEVPGSCPDDDYQNIVNINEIDLSDPNFVQQIFTGSIVHLSRFFLTLTGLLPIPFQF